MRENDGATAMHMHCRIVLLYRIPKILIEGIKMSKEEIEKKITEIRNARRFKDNSLIISSASNSTIIGSNMLNYQGRFYSDLISETYLLNYKCNNNMPDFANSISMYSSENAICSMRVSNKEDDDDAIKLVKPKKLKGLLETALLGRKSVRRYSSRGMNFQDLSSLLYYALGVKGEGEPERIFPRSYPSGGGFYPIYLYFYIENMEGIDSGYYKYQPYSNSIKYIGKRTKEKNELVNLKGIDEDNVHFIGFWVYERRRNAMKYGDLGITMGIFEAGMAAQTMELVGYHLGIGFCDLGGIEKRNIEKEIKIDGLDTHVIGSFVAGIEI